MRMLILFILMPMITYAQKPTKIFIANSYHEDFFWTNWILKGLNESLKKSGISYSTKSTYLDAFSVTDKEKRRKKTVEIFAEIKKYNPDFVLCTDDDAMAHICMKLTRKNVLFNGINGIEKYIKPGKINSLDQPGNNMTGIFQKSYFKETMDLAIKISPELKTFSVIKDFTTTSNEQYQELKKMTEKLPLKFIEMVEAKDFIKWKNESKRLSKNTDVVFVLNPNAVYDGDNVVPYEEVFRWMGSNLNVPTLSTWKGPVENGILLSAADDGENQGKQSALQILRILNGQKVGNIPIIYPPNGVPVINIKTVYKLGLVLNQDTINLFINQGQVFGVK